MPQEDDLKFAEDILDRISTNVSMLVDHELAIGTIKTERVNQRPVGKSQVHINFKLVFEREDEETESWGSVLLPFPEAVSLACYLMMLSDSEVEGHREAQQLDDMAKDALLELGNFIASAFNESLRVWRPGYSVRSAGCQGVRADVRPAFQYEEGEELLVLRGQTKVHKFPEFELIGMMPPLELVKS